MNFNGKMINVPFRSYAGADLTDYRSSDTVGSIVTWFQGDDPGPNYNSLFCYADTAGSANYFWLYVLADATIRFQPVHADAGGQPNNINAGGAGPRPVAEATHWRRRV